MTWLMKPLQLGPGAIAANNGGIGLPIANLLDVQPKVVFALNFGAAWSLSITLDLGEDRVVDTLGLLFHNGGAAGTWRAFTRTAAQGAAPGFLDDTGSSAWFAATSWRLQARSSPPRRHALHAGDRRTARYIKIYADSPDGSNPEWFAGNLVIGERLEPGRDDQELAGFDWGAGRRVSDMSVAQDMPGGEQFYWKGAKVPEVRGTFSHLTDDEREQLWAIWLEAGESDPVLLCEAADTLGAANGHERLHYGTLRGIDFWNRRQPNKAAADVRLRDWL